MSENHINRPVTLEIGDTLEMPRNGERFRRLVYLGDGRANLETWIPKVNAQGKPNAKEEKWIVDPYYPQHANIALTAEQIDFWTKQKEG